MGKIKQVMVIFSWTDFLWVQGEGALPPMFSSIPKKNSKMACALYVIVIKTFRKFQLEG